MRVIYKTPDNYAKAFIIHNYCNCFMVNLPTITFDFKKELFLNSFDTLDPDEVHSIDGHNYRVKIATAPSEIYEEVYTAHPGGYYTYAYGYSENSIPYDGAWTDYEKIKNESDLSDPNLIKFRTKTPVNTVAYWLWDFDGFSKNKSGIDFSNDPYSTSF